MPLTDSPHEGRHLGIGDTRLFVVERGLEGYPLICLHPLGRDHWTFGDYLDGLAPEIRVVLPDLRGHGMSDPVHSVTVAQLASDVEALADALEVERYALLAQGDSARVAALAAQSNRASHLIVIPDGQRPTGEYERRIAPAVERSVHIDAGPVQQAEQVPDHVEEQAYPYVHDQDAFLDRVRQSLGMISRS